MRVRRPLCCATTTLALAAAVPGLALDPSKSLQQYGIDTWDARDGLPMNSINAVWRGPDGYLWIGSDAGLARFDGSRFVVFDHHSTAGLDADHVTILFGQRDGTLWVGGRGVGAVRLDGPDFTRVSVEATVTAFTESDDGQLWYGGGAARSGASLFSLKDGLEVDRSDIVGDLPGSTEALAWDSRSRTLWLAHSLGLIGAGPDGVRRYTREDGLSSDIPSALLVDREGALWVATPDAGLNRFDGSFERFSSRDGLPSDTVFAMLEDRHGVLWIGTSAGLVRRTGGRFEVLDSRQGLPHGGIRALHEDVEGSLWVGTDGGGLARLKDGVFTSFTSSEGLPEDRAHAVLETHDGAIWVGTNGGLARLESGRGPVTVLTQADGLPSDRVMSLAEDPAGGLWVGTESGLVRWNDGRVVAHPVVAAMRRAVRERLWVRSILPRRDALWLAGAELWRVRRDGSHVVQAHRPDGATMMPTVFGAGPDGEVWAGSYDGLLSLESGGVARTHTLYATKDQASRGVVYAMLVDGEGSVWAATRDRGLALYANGRVSFFSAAEGLPSNTLYAVLEDDVGRLWISSAHGIFHVPKRELAAVAAGERSGVRATVYGLADGLKSDEGDFFGTPPAWKGRDGRLWFCTRLGVAVVDPGLVVADTTPTPVVIHELVTDRERRTDLREVTLPPGTRDLEIHYAGLKLAAPERLRFRYRLDGVDSSWVMAGRRRTAYYTQVPPGRRVFRVQASNGDGRWAGDEATLRFEVEPHYYQTAWFRLAMAALLLLCVLGGHRMRVVQLRARERELARSVDERTAELQNEIAEHERTEARLAAERDLRRAAVERETLAQERARIARELHDSLAQNFAGLSLQLQSVAADIPDGQSAARASLQLADRMLRHCQTEARRAVWDLRSPVGDSQSLRESLEELVEPLRGTGGPEIELVIAPPDVRLRPLQQRHVLRIAEEAIANAVTHAGASRIGVTCRADDGELRLEVCDDGRGYSPEHAVSGESGHFGVLGMTERAGKLRGRLEIASRPGEGTRVSLRFPREAG